jgi:peptidoglycan/LPS O-acetylase OafA/YrhL
MTNPPPSGTSTPGTKGRRWELVDMLRGIAVLLVLFRHHDVGGPLHDFGWMGVDLFFVLSGFLVSGLIFDEYRRTGEFRGLHFLIRRGFKIYPSFYALILVSAGAMLLTGRTDPIMNYVAEIFFFQNYHEGLWVHTWSLGVEEHFYFILVIVASLVILRKVRFDLRAMIVTCIVLFLFFLGLRMATWLGRPFEVRTHFYATHLRMDSLLGGVLLAAIHRYRPEGFQRFFREHRWVLIGAIVLLLLPTILTPFGSFIMYTFGLTGIYLAGAIALGLAVTADPLNAAHALQKWWVRPVAWVGAISYTTYLWHLFVLLVVELGSERLGFKGSEIEFVVFVALSVAAGFVTSILIERPFLHLRERWFPSRSRSVV